MRHRRGFILPMVIFALAIMGVLGLIVVGTAGDDRLGSRYQLEGTRSFNAAESGLASVLANWQANGYEGLVPNVGNETSTGWVTLAGSGGSYRASIVKVETNTYVITVDGQTPGARKGLRTVQIMLTPGVNFSYGMRAGTTLGFGGGGTDSFDSRIGNYAASNCTTLAVTCDGNLESNGTISLTSGQIKGDADAVGSISGCATYVVAPGTCTSGIAPIPMPAVTCPSGTYNDLTVGATTVLDVPATTYHYHNLTVSGGSAQLNFNFTTNRKQHVDVYISGQFKIQGGAQVNNLSLEPPLVTFWGCGPDATAWTMSGGSDAYFAVYAPKHAMTISGGSGFYGSFVGLSVTVSGGGTKVHYDEALASVPSPILIPGSWTEITR